MVEIKPSTILMAATIKPAAKITESQRNDPAVRLADYLGAFEFYLGLSDQLVDQIVIVENSDADLTPFNNLSDRIKTNKKIRLVSTASDYDAERGKGYSEFLMIDSGLEALRHLGFVVPDTRLWKVTGRLTCANMARMIQTAPSDYTVYCDLRSVPFIGERLGGNDWMDLRLFSCTLAAYDSYFKGRFGEHRTLEKGFFEIVKEAMREDSRIFPRFRIQPKIQGFGGFDNRNYSGRGYRAKDALRQITRRIIPRLWI